MTGAAVRWGLKSRALACLLAVFCILPMAALALTPPPKSYPLKSAQVLVFSKTAGFRHASIAKGQQTFQSLARQNGFSVTFTEDAGQFRDDILKTYDAVVFLNTTGDVLDADQQAAFERYISSGHGLLGIHAATDTERDGSWPWYINLIGASFVSHPAQSEARLVIMDPQNPAIAADAELAKAGDFHMADEWYNFANVSPTLVPIIDIDGSSYKGAASTGINPMVWSNRFSGGRAFYIGLGHRDEDYDLPLMQRLMLQGLIFARQK
ncbi:MAG: ThuA domain-containing protein [Asticcacaulis sp.]|nr:ThuA domain-containing protein [Asticcacaulis sp.]